MRKIFLFLCVVFMAAPTVARAVECNLEHCKTCLSGTTYCDSCEDGWGASGGKCYELLDHCASQSVKNGTRNCTVCEKGWIISGKYGEQKCVKQTVEHCTSISEADLRFGELNGLKQCSLCETGYGVKRAPELDKDDQCVPCSDKNARSCTKYDDSSLCKSGYSLGSVLGQYTNWCFKTVANCAKYKGYKNNGGCSECKSGYELKNGACVKTQTACSANCSECGSTGVCTTCAAGYSLIGGKCMEGTVAQCPDDSTMSSDGCCCIPN